MAKKIFVKLDYKHNNKLPDAYRSVEILCQFSQNLQLVLEEGLEATLPYCFLEGSHSKHYPISSPLQR